MRIKAPVLAGSMLAVTLLTACGPSDAIPSQSPSGPVPAQSDVEPTVAPKAGDCVGSSESEIWLVSCASRTAVARVTRQVPHGQSGQCTTDDYTGFDFSDPAKPSVCLMLYGTAGDCYSGFDKKVATGPRVACTDPKATLRLVQVLTGDGRDRCAQLTRPGDPDQSALFYGDVPDFTGRSGTGADLTYCLGSP